MNIICALLPYVLSILPHSILGVDAEIITDAKKKEVLGATQLTFYGIDFSKLRLINPNKIEQGELIKYTYCPAWIEMFDKDFPEKKVKKMLSVIDLRDKRTEFQSEQLEKNDETTAVSYKPPMLNADSIELIVADYNLRETSGIGMSLILSQFRKHDEDVTGFVTFFDIGTRELLYVVKVHAKAGGRGMVEHWFVGLKDVWLQFIADTYDREKKRYGKGKL